MVPLKALLDQVSNIRDRCFCFFQLFILIFESNLLISFYKKQYGETHRNKNFSIRAEGIEEALSIF